MGVWLRRGFAVVIIGICIYYYMKRDPISELDVHGYWEPQFKEVADIFRNNLRSGFMRGATFAAYKDGKLVVDLWGGYTDEENKLLWREDTIAHAASVTKFVAIVAFSTLIDKGLIEYDQPVIKYWPEFGQHGKENITVNQLISHQAGLHYLDTVVSFRDIIDDPKKIDEILAAQKPAWKPGTAIGYHAFTIGMYVDYLARRVDPKNRSIYQIYEEEIKIPLDLDFHIGTPRQIHYRLARPQMPTFKDHLYTFMNLPSYRYFLYAMWTGKALFLDLYKNLSPEEMTVDYPYIFIDPYVRDVPIAAASGTGTARSLAKLAGFVAAGTTVDGRRLLSQHVVDMLSTASLNGEELLMGLNATVGHGTFIFQNPKGDDVFGHPGMGGQMSYSDPKYKVGLAFLTNYFFPLSTNDELRFVPLERAFYKCLDTKP